MDELDLLEILEELEYPEHPVSPEPLETSLYQKAMLFSMSNLFSLSISFPNSSIS